MTWGYSYDLYASVFKAYRGMRWCSWLRQYTTSQKAAGSIPDGVIGIFHWHNPSGHTMALGLTQPLTEMSKVKWSRYRPDVTQRVGRGIALLFHDRGTRRGWVVSSMPRPHFTPGKDPLPILQEAGWAPGLVWMGRISRPHRDSIPAHPARSQSLYRLSYPAHQQKWVPGIFPRGKGGRCVGLTTLSLSCADCLEIWEPQSPGTLWACADL